MVSSQSKSYLRVPVVILVLLGLIASAIGQVRPVCALAGNCSPVVEEDCSSCHHHEHEEEAPSAPDEDTSEDDSQKPHDHHHGCASISTLVLPEVHQNLLFAPAPVTERLSTHQDPSEGSPRRLPVY